MFLRKGSHGSVFASALEKANSYTFPVIISRLHASGAVKCACGAFIVLNRDGWIVTAAHVFDVFRLAEKHNGDRLAHKAEVVRITTDPNIRPKKARQLVAQLPSEDWIVKHSYFWNSVGVHVDEIYAESACDLAVARLKPFDPTWVKEYPVLKDPASPMPVGTSLCRLGFPFHTITATFDESNRRFVFENGVLPVPRFPNDGIHTQVIICSNPDGSTGKFIQTSTPGLRGQSGGPIFDTSGNVWAIQSQTRSLPLDFSPKLTHAGKEVTEHQFMNVGWGSHVEELIRILDSRGIAYQKSATNPATHL